MENSSNNNAARLYFLRFFHGKQNGSSRHLLCRATKNELFAASKCSKSLASPNISRGTDPNSKSEFEVRSRADEICHIRWLRPGHASYSRLLFQCNPVLTDMTTPFRRLICRDRRGRVGKKGRFCSRSSFFPSSQEYSDRSNDALVIIEHSGQVGHAD